jgi:hypothetical protein
VSGKTVFATHPKIPMAKHYRNHDQFEEVKFISPFVSPKLTYEVECLSPPSYVPKPCPSGHQTVVLDNGRDSTLNLHDISFEKENLYAMDILAASTLETKGKDSTDKHESFSFETPHVSCSLLASLEFVLMVPTCSNEDPNLLPILVHKLFRRMVVDAFIYHKYCRSHRCTVVVLTLQLEH